MENTTTQEVIVIKDNSKLQNETAMLVRQVEAVEVTTDEQEMEAAELGVKLRGKIKEREDFLKDEIAQADQIHKSLCAKRKLMVDPLRSVLERLSEKMGFFQNEKRRKKQEEEDRARKAAEEKEKKQKQELLDKAVEAEAAGDTDKAEDLLQRTDDVYVAPRPVAPVVKPTGTALTFDVEVLIKNPKLIPDEFKIVDVAKLKRRFKESKYTLQVQGVQFIKKPITNFRSAR